MSAQRLSLWSCVRTALSCGALMLAALPDFTTGKNCSHPLVPEHGGFRCEPSPCRGFPQKSIISFFCETGYILPKRHHRSKCQHGEWRPAIPDCMPLSEGQAEQRENTVNSIPSVGTTAIGVSIFLLTTTACLVIKSRLFSCRNQRRSSDQLDLVVDGLPVSLPTYEEAIYSSWGQRLPPFRGPTQLLLTQDASEHSPLTSLICPDSNHCTDAANQSTETAPPPYEEVQSRSRDTENDSGERALQSALSVDKNN
ncbi:sushi domain-containing protein 6 [Carassius auratus]|uniref:Sushi domain-containing protein 6-like n=1 Tax=Carassius auratus TaxID=7957 RepID=A0A6P6QXT0_CARAU|nr:sushi domain-containing protein 6-like [Carassius auratus]XP_026137986.1 sushi domain-containing protein 6-like [Carassius auratus]XP_052431903.1 sushi domain-containing protein 6 [Carassius gibelio]XP_052431904.1 sushi domain-containing protein 6 [Carassius gibelio]